VVWRRERDLNPLILFRMCKLQILNKAESAKRTRKTLIPHRFLTVSGQ
jgi:hypothetical protein